MAKPKPTTRAYVLELAPHVIKEINARSARARVTPEEYITRLVTLDTAPTVVRASALLDALQLELTGRISRLERRKP